MKEAVRSGDDDVRFMRLALALAARGKGMTHPNPMVGAVVVRGGEVVGKGYHRGPFTPHAEVVALAEASGRTAGSTLYVTLEPCNHHGRTPPCTEAVLRAGVSRVVIAAPDPNPEVKGGGAERLRSAGIDVEMGILRQESEELNAAYIKYVTTGLPLVTLKVAATADGKVAARNGVSRWITGKAARRLVHEMRRVSDAVLVGRGTVEADDPELTVRHVPLRGAHHPLRVVVDSHLTMGLDRRLARGGHPKVVVATTAEHDAAKAEELRRRGVEVWVVGASPDGGVDLLDLLRALGREGVAHLLVEGGPTLMASLLREGLADRLVLFLAPRVFGDREARSWVEGLRVEDPSQGLDLRWTRQRRVGEDLMLEAEVVKRKTPATARGGA
ncbi:bifunctional diaminohydroxyphosphoribosylaminopyrimidine deaminase/5-amino-6-(5-phosphoribosylamino)uracil reductase RibD [Candidatus Solincola tengchongensis]|uniref:bifunctional diaminohydroxyphosphoribosylaminopyrimidine deaminase/5-amino-6-(5-phosphoribosylamino)uracil reductase RibD n=1 Tax=Candidatus Solincola tengchongensis TaxID=2900693 RepID=UPI00257C446C